MYHRQKVSMIPFANFRQIHINIKKQLDKVEKMKYNIIIKYERNIKYGESKTF